MEPLFQQFIDHQLLNLDKTSSLQGRQITVIFIHTCLQKLIKKSLSLQSSNLMTLSKVRLNLQQDYNNQVLAQTLDKNQLYVNSLNQISKFIFKLSYGHSCGNSYPKYNIQNIIGFYQTSKWLYYSPNIFSNILTRKKYNDQVIELILTQKLSIYKDIYYRIEQSEVFKNFIQELFKLITNRVKVMFFHFGIKCTHLNELCLSHIKSLIQRYQIDESTKHNQTFLTSNIHSNSYINVKYQGDNPSQQTQFKSQQSLNSIAIDEIIICFIYLVYRLSHNHSNVRMSKIIQEYYAAILKWKKWKINGKTTEFYNSYYLKLYLDRKLSKVQKTFIQIDLHKASKYIAILVENQQTILDNFVSSLQG